MEKSTAVQKLHEISIEYDFSVPIFTITSLGYNKTLPPFNATCAIFKNHVNYKCESEPASTKKTAKQNVARIMLNTLLEKYIFSEQTATFVKRNYLRFVNEHKIVQHVEEC